MKVFLPVVVLLVFLFSSECFSQIQQKRSPDFDQLIRESMQINEQLVRENEAARNDAIIAIALMGKKLSKQRREEIHMRMVDSLEYVKDRLVISQQLLSQLTASDPRIDGKLLDIGIWHNEVAELYYLFKELRKGLEEGRYDYSFFNGF